MVPYLYQKSFLIDLSASFPAVFIPYRLFQTRSQEFPSHSDKYYFLVKNSKALNNLSDLLTNHSHPHSLCSNHSSLSLFLKHTKYPPLSEPLSFCPLCLTHPLPDTASTYFQLSFYLNVTFSLDFPQPPHTKWHSNVPFSLALIYYSPRSSYNQWLAQYLLVHCLSSDFWPLEHQHHMVIDFWSTAESLPCERCQDYDRCSINIWSTHDAPWDKVWQCFYCTNKYWDHNQISLLVYT